MKNKSAILGIGLLAVGVLSLAGIATYNFAYFSKELLVDVFDKQISTANYYNSQLKILK